MITHCSLLVNTVGFYFSGNAFIMIPLKKVVNTFSWENIIGNNEIYGGQKNEKNWVIVWRQVGGA